MKFFSIILVIIVSGWFLFVHPSKAQWVGQVAVSDPVQVVEGLPSSWEYKHFTITPRAKYQIKAVVLSKHSYWAGEMEDQLAQYDLALGWGPMSEASVINQLKISQSGRWYEYRWEKFPPIDPSLIISHSANNHIIPANDQVLDVIKKIKQHDVVELQGYLVDIQDKQQNWQWHTSLSRTDTAGGSCEVFWVTTCLIK